MVSIFMNRIFTSALGRTHIMKTRFVQNFSFNFFKSILLTSILGLFSSCLSDFGLGTRGNVDLSKATWLVAEKVPLISDKGGIPGAPPGSGGPVVFNNLFSLPPGTKVKASALGGTIDPTGTTIVNDFDGDGILNVNETTTNVWVADYPLVESVIAPPITMKIAIKVSTSGNSSEISSDINSDDFESGKSQGSEKIHQNELNLRTVQFQDQYSSSNELSQTVGNSVSIGTKVNVGPADTPVAGGGFNYSASSELSWSAKNSLSMTTTKWADRPFKNNIDSDALNLKSNSSSQNARKFRSEKSNKVDTNSQIDSDAGYVRAALYIKNNSVNMPVKLKNILCSLMFETPTGELIPITSFRLKNDDNSTFEIDVYGGTEFGPYVIEVDHLNRSEVERAIASGYNPKIFIVDYEMTHVTDSNYKSSLLNFSGDNLKVIEENAKGRTALIKIIGPNMREMYRVAAFEADGGISNPCETQSAAQLSPGVSLKSALDRIACSGMEIEYEDYVLDFSEIAPTLSESKLHLKGIKNLAGLKTNLPCDPNTKTGSDNVSRTACVQKPYKDWTEAEKASAGIWAIFSKGKYYAPTAYFLDGTGPNATPRKFDPFGTTPALMVKGPESIIWAGDSYDIVYISFKDLAAKQQQFGTNPLETNDAYYLNTAWDLAELGKHPYYPDTRALFLGDAGFGEKVQLQIKLNETNYLTPNFGTPTDGGLSQYFTDFSYNYKKPTNLFDINQAIDFEISLGFGGTRTDWLHVIKDINAGDNFKMTDCGRTLDFTSQTYYLCIQLPKDHLVVDPNISLIKLYIRPALNNAYRRTVWPLRYSEVRKVQGTLFAPAFTGDLSVLVSNASIITDGGSMYQAGDSLKVFGDSKTYTVQSVAEQSCEPDSPNTALCKRIYLTSAITKASRKTSSVYVMAGLTSPNMKLSVDSGFFTDWNTTNPATPTGSWETPQYLSLLTGNGTVNCSITFFHPSCLGLNPDYITLNWIGAYNQGVAHANSWADSNNLQNMVSQGLFWISSVSNKIFQLTSAKGDVVITDNIQSKPKIVSYGDTALAVYSKSNFLYGRYYQLSTGNSLSSEFVINPNHIQSSNGASAFEVKIKNSKAFVSWISQVENSEIPPGFDNEVFASLDLSILATIGIAQSTYTLTSPQIELNDTKVIGIHPYCQSDLSGSNYTPYCRIDTRAVDAANAQVTSPNNVVLMQTGPTGTLSTVNAYVKSFTYDWKVSDNRLHIVTRVDRTNPATDYTIVAGSIDIDTGNTNGGQFTITTVSGSSLMNSSATPSVSSVNNQALIIWRAPNNDLKAVVVDMIAKTVGTIQTVDTSISDNSPKALALGSQGYILYSKGNRMYMRRMDLSNGQFLDTSALVDSASTATAKNSKALYTSNNRLLAVWEHTESSKTSIRVRSLNSSPYGLTSPTEFILNTTSAGNHTDPSIAVTGQNAMALWSSSELGNQIRVRGANFNFNQPATLPYGMNNFFVAPLIEREYSLKAKITY